MISPTKFKDGEHKGKGLRDIFGEEIFKVCKLNPVAKTDKTKI